jgi:GT2 family glycosyltransferase
LLSWGLVIATYGRGAVLAECVRLAIHQTRPPSEVVIVDASPDWEATRSAVQELVQARGISLRYLEAVRPSSTGQRNQGIAVATADIVFLIDDDTFLYRDCAERILEVYESDPEQRIAGVGGMQNETPPPEADPRYEVARGPESTHGTLRERTESFVRRAASRGSGYFLPYDRNFPEHPIPEGCRQLPVRPVRVLDGYRMTLRRTALEKVRFEEVLTRYAVSEDQDLSYRVSRFGLLVETPEARLTHLAYGGGRLSKRTVATLRTTNRIALNVLHSPHRSRTLVRYAAAVPYHTLVGLAHDLVRGDLELPEARGTVAAIAPALRLLAMSPDRVRAWYPSFQARLLDRSKPIAQR